LFINLVPGLISFVLDLIEGERAPIHAMVGKGDKEEEAARIRDFPQF
jgi:hypothetical protein